MGQLTPMMQQYMEIKKQHPDKILFYRLGDFYEMFFDDALTASKELEITLTGKECGMEERAPMCGVPHHSAEMYIKRLIDKNYKVAICEQMEDPATAKGIVKRDVVKIVTPGTVTSATMLDETRNNFILSLVFDRDVFALSYADLSTGEFNTTWLGANEKQTLFDELNKLEPSEIICNIKHEVLLSGSYPYTVLDKHYYGAAACRDVIGRQFHTDGTEGLGIGQEAQVKAIGALLRYLNETQKTSVEHIRKVNNYSLSSFMKIDFSTRRNLELTETMMEKKKKGSLLSVLDRTSTAMGSRRLRQWLENPLLDREALQRRLDATEELVGAYLLQQELKEYLKSVYDIERLAGRIALGSANGRDLVSFKNSVTYIPAIKTLLRSVKSNPLSRIANELDALKDIHDLIEAAIVDDPPVTIKEGGLIRKGYRAELDQLMDASTNGKQWMVTLEQKERDKTGIKNLKIGYNRVFGYYIDVTKSYLSQVPDYFVRKQTLANSERYITPELKELENIVLGAEEKLIACEYETFVEIRTKIAAHIDRIQKTAGLVAELDVYCSFAEVAQKNDYHRPEVDYGDTITILQGRHPVVEAFGGFHSFVPNDVSVDTAENRMIILTGPNMSGKSTYMRQIALITLMAQIGSFVPAERAHIGIVDRIFTRVGASDDLASGRSTFMVEMSELSNILTHATRKSLVILDEIGRGTSTLDGLSIAWSVVEYITSVIGAKTLFATHYHELTELEDKLEGVKNFSVSVLEEGNNIVFLRKIIRGGANGSYGIHVARLAGLPETVLERADEILMTLEGEDRQRQKVLMTKKKKTAKATKSCEPNLFNFGMATISEELAKVDVNHMTPMEAMNLLVKLKDMVNQ